MQSSLIGLWHFDEPFGTVALNEAPGLGAVSIHGGGRETRGFGSALTLAHPGDHARGPGLGSLPTGSVAFWLRMDRDDIGADILDVHGTLQVLLDSTRTSGGAGASGGTGGTGLMVALGDGVLATGRHLRAGQWTHLVISFSPDGACLYLDGESVQHESDVQTGLAQGADRHNYFEIGPIQRGSSGFAIDELAIFNKALTPTEVRQLAFNGITRGEAKRATPTPRDVDAKAWLNPSDPTCGLQRAIEEAGPAGGRVLIPPGRYPMRAGLVLPSYLTLAGVGGQAVLTAPPPRMARLVSDVRAGTRSVAVDDPSQFTVGDAIMLRSGAARGWFATHTQITAIDGHILRLARPITRSLVVEQGAIAVRWFSMITAFRQHEVHIENLQIEGVPEHAIPLTQDHPPLDYTVPAILMDGCTACHIRDCRITGWPHDGIGVHGGSDVDVADCHVTRCLAHGLHAGSDTRRAHWAGNRSSQNGLDGLYLGTGVRESAFTFNHLLDNARHGIGGVGEGDDTGNLIHANQCSGNGACGIDIGGGESHTVTQNICRDNSRRDPGKWPGIRLASTQANVVIGNQCISTAEPATQTIAILEEADATSNLIRDNMCFGGELRLRGSAAGELGNIVKRRPRKAKRTLFDFGDDG